FFKSIAHGEALHLIMAGKPINFLRNGTLEPTQNHKGNNRYGQSQGETPYCNFVYGGRKSPSFLKTDSFGDEIGKVQRTALICSIRPQNSMKQTKLTPFIHFLSITLLILLNISTTIARQNNPQPG